MASVVMAVLRERAAAGLPHDSSDDPSGDQVTLAKEGRLLVEALQNGHASEQTLLRLLYGQDADARNAAASAVAAATESAVADDAATDDEAADETAASPADGNGGGTASDDTLAEVEDESGEAALRRRLRRILHHLNLDNVDGVVAVEDLREVKGRVYTEPDSAASGGDTLAHLRTGYMRNEAVVQALRDKVRDHIKYRHGYTLCFLHLLFLAVFAGVLACQADTPAMWEIRRAIVTAAFPESFFGEGSAALDTVVLDGQGDFSTYLHLVLDAVADSSGAGALFHDPGCGDGKCTAPIEHPAWRTEALQTGCALDCGTWTGEGEVSSATPGWRQVSVHLSVSNTLSDDEVAELRWNLICPSVTYFEQQLKYFPEDQTVSVVSTAAGGDDDDDANSWTLLLFDCDWQLRLHSPHGGVSGSVSFATVAAAVTGIQVVHPDVNVAVERERHKTLHLEETATLAVRDTTTVAWDGCDGPPPRSNVLLGYVAQCTDTVGIFFNRSVFVDPMVQTQFAEAAKAAIVQGLEALGELSYNYHVAPTCECLGPTHMDCAGAPCPTTVMSVPGLDACPVLCDKVEELYPSNRTTACQSVDNSTSAGVENVTIDQLPCTYETAVYNATQVAAAMRLNVAGFDYDPRFAHPQCMLLQIKVRTDNATERALLQNVFSSEAVNDSGVLTVHMELNLTDVARALGMPDLVVSVDPTPTEPEGSVCNTDAKCLFDFTDASEIIDFGNMLGLGVNPCELLETMYGCETAGCGCPYHECANEVGCYGRSCDLFPWLSCTELETPFHGCDCTDCLCAAGNDCPRTCFGMSCDSLIAVSESELSFFLAHPVYHPSYDGVTFLPQSVTYEQLEDMYGCNCRGCTGGSLSNSSRRLAAETDAGGRTASAGIGGRDPLSVLADLRRFVADPVRREEPKAAAAPPPPPAAATAAHGSGISDAGSGSGDGMHVPLLYPGHAFGGGGGSSAWSTGGRVFVFPGSALPWEQRAQHDSQRELPGHPPRRKLEGAPRRRRLADDDDDARSAAWPLDAEYCDAASECDLAMQLNGVCDRDCAVAACGWDFGDCCEPTFPGGGTRSLDTEADTRLLTLRVAADDGRTPHDNADAPVNRVLAQNHQLVGGLLFEQARRQLEPCEVGDFTAVELGSHTVDALSLNDACLSETLVTRAFGTDAVFKMDSELYDDRLDAAVCHPDGLSGTGFPFVRVPSAVANNYGWPMQWASTLARAREDAAVPGFFDTSELSAEERANVAGAHPVFIDVRFTRARVVKMIQYMFDGLYVDKETEEMTMHQLYYNQKLNILTYVQAVFERYNTGSVEMIKKVISFSPTPYNGTQMSALRLFLEVLFVCCVLASAVWFFFQWAAAARKPGAGACDFLKGGWRLLDIATLGLQVAAAVLWLECVLIIAPTGFQPRMTYDIVDIDPKCPSANLARVNNSEVTELRLIYSAIENYARHFSAYNTVSALVFMLMTLQLLRALHFQKKLNLITRTVGAASGDLFHLFILFGLVEVSFALLGHVVYGHNIPALATFAHALVTLLLALFGDFDVAYQLGELYGFMGYFYYFVYMMVAFLLLLNMLLAILVDAYISVRAESDAATGVLPDLLRSAKTNTRAVSRPSDMMSNEDVAAHLDKWVTPVEQPKQHDKRVPMAPGYALDEADLRRVLLMYATGEHGRMQRAQGQINDGPQLEEDVDRMIASIMYHYGARERPNLCASKANRKKHAAAGPRRMSRLSSAGSRRAGARDGSSDSVELELPERASDGGRSSGSGRCRQDLAAKADAPPQTRASDDGAAAGETKDGRATHAEASV